MMRRRPWLRLKIAATMDGKTALNSGLSRWISGAESRRDAHHLRARSCAVLTGIGTALQDNPALTVRHVQSSRQPLRVLVDSSLRARPDMALFADDNVLVATAAPSAMPTPTHIVLPDARGKVDLAKLLTALAARGINEVTVEAGRKLNGAFLAAGLVDEIVLYVAARVFGGGKDMFAAVTPSLTDAPRFKRVALRGMKDGDIKIVYQNPDAFAKAR